MRSTNFNVRRHTHKNFGTLCNNSCNSMMSSLETPPSDDLSGEYPKALGISYIKRNS